MTALTAYASGVAAASAATVWANSADLEHVFARSLITLTPGPGAQGLAFWDAQRRWVGFVDGLGDDSPAMERTYRVRAADGVARFSCVVSVVITAQGSDRSLVVVRCAGSSTDATTVGLERLSDAWRAAIISEAPRWAAASGHLDGAPGTGRSAGGEVSWYGAAAATGAGILVGAVLTMRARGRR